MKVWFAIAAAAAVWFQPAHASVLMVDYYGHGPGSLQVRNDPTWFGPTWASGNFSFDLANNQPIAGGLFNSITGDALSGQHFDGFAKLVGNNIEFNLTVSTPGMIDWVDLSLLFPDGFLNGSFPTSLRRSQALSATYSATEEWLYGPSVYISSNGSLSSINFSEPGDVAPLNGLLMASPSFGGGGAPVPEPTTWAMMMLGFLGVGTVLRSRQSRQSTPIYA